MQSMMSAETNSEKSVSYQKKDGNDKDIIGSIFSWMYDVISYEQLQYIIQHQHVINLKQWNFFRIYSWVWNSVHVGVKMVNPKNFVE